MFAASRTSTHRRRSASRSTDDHSIKEKQPRRLFQRYAHDLSMSSQSLATSSSQYDDLHIPSFPIHASHSHQTSAPSTPTTSPSTGYSSLFPGSLSSATSESGPYGEHRYRSEFGVLTPASHSPIPGSASSRSSNILSPWLQSVNDSDSPPSASRVTPRHLSGDQSQRPSTAPHSPSVLATTSNADNDQSDRHTRTHSRLAVSLKNLLSKPAISSPSRFSFKSVTSTTIPETETSPSSFYFPVVSGKWSMTPRKLRPNNIEISGTVVSALPSPSSDSTPIDAHRRYASEAVSKMGISPTTRDSLDVVPPNVPPLPARGREPKTRNVLRRRPSGSAKLVKGRERGMSSPSLPHEGDPDHLRLSHKDGMSRPSGTAFPPLTPASAVVEAYKQQELHRDHYSLPKLSIDQMSSTISHEDGYDQDRSARWPTSHLPFVGSSSDRRLQTGDAADRQNRFEADWSTPQSTSSQPSSTSDSAGRGLTRKVSNRWRKFKGGEGGGTFVASEESPSRGRGHSKSRPSLQEMWGVGGDKSSMRSTGRSIDGLPNPSDGAWASPSVRHHARSGSDKGDGSSDGGKLWRIMRRISTGGLRDRFQSVDKVVVPPVPAIPKELLSEKSNEAPSRSRRHQPSSSSHDKDFPSTPAPRSITATRPSLATSSSPNSSDVASTQFFAKTHSARSSVSSYGEVVADIVFNRHIIAPQEQLRLGDDQVKCACNSSSSLSVLVPRSPRRSASVPAGLLRALEGADSDSDAAPPLPCSPRQQTSSGDSPSCGSSRPPSMSASGGSSSASGSARASFQQCGRSRMADGIVSLSPPPPRPSRHSKRGGDWSTTSSPSHSITVGNGVILRQMDRMPSARSDMTARVEFSEPAGRPRMGRHASASSTPPATKAETITFRELDAPRRPPLSEQEKADIWNDLLERSDRAGGTLHINGAAELMSDSMRFSMISEG